MLGYPVEDLRRAPLNRLVDPDDLADLVETNRLLLEGYLVRDHSELRMVKADGEAVWVALERSVVTDSVGHPVYVLGHFDDITQEVPQSHRAVEPEVVDPLTGLANRRMLDRVLARELDAESPMVGVVFCDIDGMRAVNEQMGQGTGDRVLREVASELRSSVRADDLVARFGGDEFVVVVKGPRCAEVVERLVDSFHDYTLGVGGGSLLVSLSAGSAVGIAGQHTDDLLALADRSMFEAKHRRRAEHVASNPRV
jgi:diguanylate cyclase (GGDEF)-like protein/PAS domain S-box-containing protein